MQNTTTYEKGQKVTTKYGEELTVLDVKTMSVSRHGQPTGEQMTMILAESGGHNTWIPVANLMSEGE